MKKVVVDTNAYSALMRGDLEVKHALDRADRIFLPVFVIAELLFGFKHGKKEKEYRRILEAFESRMGVFRYYPNDDTAEIYSDIWRDLRKKGAPLPVHDLWIAASAIEIGGTLLTYDSHFKMISGCRVWKH